MEYSRASDRNRIPGIADEMFRKSASATCGYKTHSCGATLAENQALLEEKACQQFEINL